MKSSIKIDFVDNGSGMEPVIRVKTVPNSDDVRDKMIRSFFQKLGGESSWLQVQISPDYEEGEDQVRSYDLSAIPAGDLPNLLISIQNRISMTTNPVPELQDKA